MISSQEETLKQDTWQYHIIHSPFSKKGQDHLYKSEITNGDPKLLYIITKILCTKFNIKMY